VDVLDLRDPTVHLLSELVHGKAIPGLGERDHLGEQGEGDAHGQLRVLRPEA
jgi:hypothetical protein